MVPALGAIAVFEFAGVAINVDPVEHGGIVADGGNETKGVGMEFRVRVRDIEACEGVEGGGGGGGGDAGRWSGCGLWEDPEL